MLQPVINETIAESSYRRIRADIILVGWRQTKVEAGKLEGVLRDQHQYTSRSAESAVLRGACRCRGTKGFEVSPVSVSDLKETAALRLLLETHALEQSFVHGDVEWEAPLVSAHYKLARMEQVMASGDTSRAEDWKRYDWEFHQALISACGSKLLMETHSVIFDRYLRYQMVALSYRGDVAANEHQQLLDAALRRDAETAKRVLVLHIQGGVEHALARGTLK